MPTEETETPAAGTTPPPEQPPAQETSLADNPEVQALVQAAVAQARKDAAADERKKAKTSEDKKKAEADQDYKQLYEDAARDLAEKQVKIVRAQAAAAAGKLNAIDPEVVAALIPADTVDDEDAIKAAVAQVKSKHPRLFQAGNAAAGAGTTNGGSPGSGDDMNMNIRRAAGRVS